MRAAFPILLSLVMLVTTMPSCKKCGDTDTPHQIVNETIPMNQSYQFDLGGFGDEEGAFISRQAAHYTVSKMNSPASAHRIYTYQPAPGYTGTDEVELTSARGSDGASPNNRINYTTIRFTITK